MGLPPPLSGPGAAALPEAVADFPVHSGALGVDDAGNLPVLLLAGAFGVASSLGLWPEGPADGDDDGRQPRGNEQRRGGNQQDGSRFHQM